MPDQRLTDERLAELQRERDVQRELAVQWVYITPVEPSDEGPAALLIRCGLCQRKRAYGHASQTGWMHNTRIRNTYACGLTHARGLVREAIEKAAMRHPSV